MRLRIIARSSRLREVECFEMTPLAAFCADGHFLRMDFKGRAVSGNDNFCKYVFFSSTHITFQLLLDNKSWSQVSSLPPPGSCL